MPNKKDIEFTHMVMKSIIDGIQEFIDKELGKGYVITVLLHPENKPGVANYASTGKREDMIKALKETALRIENNYDRPAGADHSHPSNN